LLLRKIRTNQTGGVGKLPGRNLNSLSTLSVATWIVRCTPSAPGAIECCKLWRAYAPIAAFLPGHDMKVKVRCLLPTKNPVVLKRQYSEGLIRLDKRLCESLGRDHYRRAFLMGKIEQRSDVPTCDNATLANFELPGIDHGERVLALIDDRPSFGATCHSFTKVARISYGKFNQLSSPIQPANRTQECLLGLRPEAGYTERLDPELLERCLADIGCGDAPVPPNG